MEHVLLEIITKLVFAINLYNKYEFIVHLQATLLAVMDGPTPEDLDQSQPGWYIALMAPATKPPPMAWLDPTKLYLYPKVS